MKISVFSALYPPEIIGGAEIAADSLNRELVKLGHSVSVLTTAQYNDKGRYAQDATSPVAIERVFMPRPYPAMEYSEQTLLNKVIWHAEDHAAPFNYKLWADFIRRTEPDAAIVQVAQGLGFNGLQALADADIPTVYVLHDLSLACYRTSMFKEGSKCERLCALCTCSNSLKRGFISQFPRLGFVSPSQANLERVGQFVPIARHPSRVILNPIRYPSPEVPRVVDETLDLLYVGQITQPKGVEFLINIFNDLKPGARGCRLTIVGGGPELERLRALHVKSENIVFTGKVDLQSVANHMARADVLCVPSLWQENSPGVVIQALCQGLPVLASRSGGMTELVADGETGLLLEAGDALIWSEALQRLAEDDNVVETWGQNAAANAKKFDAESLAVEYQNFISHIIDSKP